MTTLLERDQIKQNKCNICGKHKTTIGEVGLRDEDDSQIPIHKYATITFSIYCELCEEKVEEITILQAALLKFLKP